MSSPRRSLVSACFALLLSCAALAQGDLARVFQDPPAPARPHTWWHWMNGNVSREGITADLEAMARIGLGGAQIFNVSESIPPGPAPFMSSGWRELFVHAVKEAERVGLELCFHNCAGWSSSGGPWITPEHAMQIVVKSELAVRGPQRLVAKLPQPETRLSFYRDIAVLAFPTPATAEEDAVRIPDWQAKAGFEARYGIEPSLDDYPAGAVIDRERIVDLTGSLTKEGEIAWDVPDGAWTILRLGHTPTGKTNHPSPDAGRGLECDKLARAGMDAHWAGGIAPLLEAVGPLVGKTLNNSLIDSYEVGAQNWTKEFRSEFQNRRGYDLLSYLPALTGRVVESGEISERFLWDFRRTIADLFADNYFTYFAELCHAHGMLASIEPYDGPFECLLAGRDADIPMGEFWVGGSESNSCKLAASVAHAYGRKLVGAESFTADPNAGRWRNHPASLKAIGDLMYTVGINRYIVHRYAHQPWMDVLPGMTMGQWGTHFERTVTWWEQGEAWVDYLSRCQHLLQQGLFVADVCFYEGEAAPNGATHDPELKAAGYDYDACGPDVLLNRMSVKDGRIVLPDGMSYRLLVILHTAFLTPREAEKLRELARNGATVLVGAKPSRSPSLQGHPDCDAQVARIAAELWGDATEPGERRVGEGRVVWGRSPREVLAAMGVGPDCAFTGATGRMAWIHRATSEGTDSYFVSNQKPRSQEVVCSFRVSGRAPELWHADTGTIEPAPIWSEHDGVTSVPMRLDASGSAFVVFTAPAEPRDHIVSMSRPATATPRFPQIEIARAVYEAVDGAGGADVTEKVRALVRTGETQIPASNSIFGDPTYMHVKRLVVEYTLDGEPRSASAEENSAVELAELGADVPAAFALSTSPDGTLEMKAFVKGDYAFTTARGETRHIRVGSVFGTQEVPGPWTVRFQPDRGAPPEVRLDALQSWTEHADPGVKYFSGTAVYEKELQIPVDFLGTGMALELDLGRVECIAEVTLNDVDLGVWWKPPFAMDISDLARPGANSLRVRVTNLWVNRLIGDEQHPADVAWNGKPLERWPEWFEKRQARPVPQRLTFTTWHHYDESSPLLESGLLGPVILRSGVRVKIE